MKERMVNPYIVILFCGVKGQEGGMGSAEL